MMTWPPHDPCCTGLTKVPIDGQPMSIVTELEDMARNYVKGENAIILAVSPANADLATSDALRLAREVDPSGDRTIGESWFPVVSNQSQSVPSVSVAGQCPSFLSPLHTTRTQQAGWPCQHTYVSAQPAVSGPEAAGWCFLIQAPGEAWLEIKQPHSLAHALAD